MRDAAINTPPDLHRLQKCSRKAPPPAERSTSPHSRAVEPRDISWPQQLLRVRLALLASHVSSCHGTHVFLQVGQGPGDPSRLHV